MDFLYCANWNYPSNFYKHNFDKSSLLHFIAYIESIGPFSISVRLPDSKIGHETRSVELSVIVRSTLGLKAFPLLVQDHRIVSTLFSFSCGVKSGSFSFLIQEVLEFYRTIIERDLQKQIPLKKYVELSGHAKASNEATDDDDNLGKRASFDIVHKSLDSVVETSQAQTANTISNSVLRSKSVASRRKSLRRITGTLSRSTSQRSNATSTASINEDDSLVDQEMVDPSVKSFAFIKARYDQLISCYNSLKDSQNSEHKDLWSWIGSQFIICFSETLPKVFLQLDDAFDRNPLHVLDLNLSNDQNFMIFHELSQILHLKYSSDRILQHGQGKDGCSSAHFTLLEKQSHLNDLFRMALFKESIQPKAGKSLKDASSDIVHILNEFVETESNYLDMLKALKEIYFQPLYEICKDDESEEYQKIISYVDYMVLFGGIDDILNANLALFDKLKATNSDPSLIGKVLNEWLPQLEVYRNYIAFYSEREITLERLLNANNSSSKDVNLFAEFVKKASLDPACKRNDLKSLLIQPVQRLCRYDLLLTSLLGRIPRDAEYRSLFSTAHKKITVIASNFDVLKAKTDAINEMYKLQFSVSGFPSHLLTPQRWFVDAFDLFLVDFQTRSIDIDEDNNARSSEDLFGLCRKKSVNSVDSKGSSNSANISSIPSTFKKRIAIRMIISNDKLIFLKIRKHSIGSELKSAFMRLKDENPNNNNNNNNVNNHSNSARKSSFKFLAEFPLSDVCIFMNDDNPEESSRLYIRSNRIIPAGNSSSIHNLVTYQFILQCCSSTECANVYEKIRNEIEWNHKGLFIKDNESMVDMIKIYHDPCKQLDFMFRILKTDTKESFGSKFALITSSVSPLVMEINKMPRRDVFCVVSNEDNPLMLTFIAMNSSNDDKLKSLSFNEISNTNEDIKTNSDSAEANVSPLLQLDSIINLTQKKEPALLNLYVKSSIYEMACSKLFQSLVNDLRITVEAPKVQIDNTNAAIKSSSSSISMKNTFKKVTSIMTIKKVSLASSDDNQSTTSSSVSSLNLKKGIIGNLAAKSSILGGFGSRLITRMKKTAPTTTSLEKESSCCSNKNNNTLFHKENIYVKLLLYAIGAFEIRNLDQGIVLHLAQIYQGVDPLPTTRQFLYEISTKKGMSKINEAIISEQFNDIPTSVCMIKTLCEVLKDRIISVRDWEYLASAHDHIELKKNSAAFISAFRSPNAGGIAQNVALFSLVYHFAHLCSLANSHDVFIRILCNLLNPGSKSGESLLHCCSKCTIIKSMVNHHTFLWENELLLEATTSKLWPHISDLK